MRTHGFSAYMWFWFTIAILVRKYDFSAQARFLVRMSGFLVGDAQLRILHEIDMSVLFGRLLNFDF